MADRVETKVCRLASARRSKYQDRAEPLRSSANFKQISRYDKIDQNGLKIKPALPESVIPIFKENRSQTNND